MRVKLDIENRTVIRVVLLIAAVWLSILVIYQIRQALMLILVSFFLAIALNRPVSYLAARIKWGGRGLATGIAYLGVITFVGIFVYLTIPPLVDETTNFIESIPQKIEDIRESSEGGAIAEFIDKYELQDEADEFVSNITDDFGSLATPLVNGVGKATTAVISLLTVLVLTFFMLVEGPSWVSRFWSFTPEDKLEHNKKLARRMQDVITSYVNGQLLIALLAGASSLIAMLILGIPNALALAGLVAIFALIPMIGTIIGSIIVVIVALSQSFLTGVVMLAFFIIYQQIENNTIQPYIQSRALNMSPLLILVSVIVGFYLGGILGGFIAIPTVAAAQILVTDWLDQRKKHLDKKQKKTT